MPLFAIVCIVAPASAATAQANDSTGTIVGIVVMKDGGLPLAYSTASIPALGKERFSTEQGVFTLASLPPGPLLLRVRHLGYSPVDLPVTVHAGRADTVNVQLVHIAVRLSTVQVRALPECKNPGVPKASADSAFATVFDQLHQNADQYRLLTDAYPFVYTVERMMSVTQVDGEARLESVDTMKVESARTWKYQPGAVISRPRRLSDGPMTMSIPTLVHFADKVFLDNHCFYNGGLEMVEGSELLRVDFNAASRIKDPDVDGAMYLDPNSFQIRRSVLRLSRIPKDVRGLEKIEAVTRFGEVLPSIPLIASIVSVNEFQTNVKQPKSLVSATEQQRLTRVEFLKGMPGDDAKKP
ncbi:MAG TPA: carboxypeptidase-like regulatory domain-containing protein [Gemmatimonadaceae bacterium]|nr:carboxypeptidase-like regulatory domain-containing protein [Gemmatimonadaceae bacterium]